MDPESSVFSWSLSLSRPALVPPGTLARCFPVPSCGLRVHTACTLPARWHPWCPPPVWALLSGSVITVSRKMSWP